MAKDPRGRNLIEAVKHNKDDDVLMLLMVGGVTNQLINFIAEMKDPDVRQNEAMGHVRRSLEQISRYALPEQEYKLVVRSRRESRQGGPVLTIGMKGIPDFPIVKIVVDASVPVTIYAKVISSVKPFSWSQL